MTDHRPASGECGTAFSILAYLALVILLQWIGTVLLGLNVGGTLVGALGVAAIGVHALCTLKARSPRDRLPALAGLPRGPSPQGGKSAVPGPTSRDCLGPAPDPC